MAKKIIYFDMDGTLADFSKDFSEGSNLKQGFFEDLKPIKGSVQAFHLLSKYFDCYIASTPKWSNPDSWKEKRLWVEMVLGKDAYKRLILTHHKELLNGDYLIDDMNSNGADKFEGEHILFGKGKFKNWSDVLSYIFKQEKTIMPTLEERLINKI